MSLWEYKVISSGKGGFATPALLESFLNQLGNDEWEIIEFRTAPDNALAFSGLARRPTERDWTLEAAAAAAAKAEADKLRAEFAAKFQAASGPGAGGAEQASEENTKRDDSFRRPRDTDSDQDPDALDDSSRDDIEDIPPEDELPTFFEAVRPHMRRNQKGPGYSVGVDYLVKKFDMLEEDFQAALVEVGFELPEDEDDKPIYIEYDGDIYWLNVNRRGEVWINTREKPRAVFKTVKGTRLSPETTQEPEAPARPENSTRAEKEARRNENRQRKQEPVHHELPAVQSEAEATAPSVSEEVSVPTAKPEPVQATPQALPEGLDLLERIRPMMRRSRGGWSGTISYLARALKQPEELILEALNRIGLVLASNPGERSPLVESGPLAYWLNKDGRGGIWINAREARRMRQETKQGESTAVGGTAETPVETEAGVGLVPATLEEPLPVAPATAACVEGQESLDTGLSSSADNAEVVAADAVPAVISEDPSPDETDAASVLLPDLSPVPEAAGAAAASLGSTVGETDEPKATVADTALLYEEIAAASPSPEDADELVSDQSEPVLERDLSALSGARLLLRETRTGAFAAEISGLAGQLSLPVDTCLMQLSSLGLRVPEKPREKPVFVEHNGEVFWLNRNAKGELWLNAKTSKYSRKEESEIGDDSEVEESPDKKPKRVSRGRRKPSAPAE